MGTYTVWSTSAVGSAAQEALVKESVGDLITNLFPLDTPLQQILEKVPMNNVFHEQPVDSFGNINRTSAAFATNSGGTAQIAKQEGATYTSTTARYPKRMIACVAEIQGLQFAVSDTDRAMSQYGMVDRFAYEALKTTEEIVNNFEMSFWWSPGTPPSGSDLDSGGGVVPVRQTQGLVHWMAKSGLQRTKIGLAQDSFTDGHGNNFGDTTDSYSALNRASSYCYDAGGVVLDDTMFKDNLMAQWYDLTGRQAGAVGFCGSKIKTLISRFALTANGAINDRTLDAASKRLVDAIDYYETDFGVVAINLCRYLNISGQSVAVGYGPSSDTVTIPYNEVLLFMKPEYFKIGVVRPVYMSPLGKTGDFEQGLIRGEQGLLCRNPQAVAGIVNCY
jgi:hypothetical protein